MTHRETILEFADRRADAYKAVAREIHAHPEVSNHEYFAQEILCRMLAEEGFTVQKDVAGHPTGFTGTYRSGKPGPTLVFLAEYDALAGIGHACGHNLFGPTSLLAAAALKQVLDQTGGEIRVYGTPGEEGGENGSAKANFVRKGFFRDVDAALCAHPGSNRHVRTGLSLACAPIEIDFYGRASHAASAPEKGINALDAVILVFNALNALRQHVPSDVRIHGIITHGGDAPNIVPEYAQARFFLRAAKLPVLKDVYAKVEKIVEGAALSTGARVTMKPSSPLVENTILTPSFDALYGRHLRELGEDLCTELPRSFGSTDVGNVSQVVPTIQPMTKLCAVPVAGHSLEKKAACVSAEGLNSIIVPAKALALTALSLIEDPALLESIQKEHAEALAAQ